MTAYAQARFPDLSREADSHSWIRVSFAARSSRMRSVR